MERITLKGITGLVAAAGLSAVVGLSSISCARAKINSQPEPRLIYGVSVESHEALREVYVEDEKGNRIYELMADGQPKTELRKREKSGGGRIGNIVYDFETTEYSLRFPEPLDSKKNHFVIYTSASGKTEKKKID